MDLTLVLNYTLLSINQSFKNSTCYNSIIRYAQGLRHPGGHEVSRRSILFAAEVGVNLEKVFFSRKMMFVRLTWHKMQKMGVIGCVIGNFEVRYVPDPNVTP